MTTKAKAYSYLRFSTPEQQKGDSKRRQVELARRYAESSTKAKRLKAAWKAKRDRAATGGHKLTSKCPAWLTLDKSTGTFQVIEDRAEVVRRIFNMTLEGLGKAKIAAQFNTEGVPTFGRSSGWQTSYVQKILNNDAVIGTFQAHRLEHDDATSTKVRVPDGEATEGYFPAIVDTAVFHRARELRSSRRIASGQTGRRFANVFSGLAKCGVCGASMSYVNKGKGWTYLHCSNARRKVGNCTAHPWPYQDTEGWLLWTGIDHFDFREVYPSMVEGARAALKALGDARVTAGADLGRTKESLSALLDAIQERQDNPHLLDRLDKLSAQEVDRTRQLAEIEASIRQEQDRLDSAGADFGAVQDALGEWFSEQDTADDARAYQLRALLNQLLKRLIAKIRFHPGDGPGRSGRKVEVQLRGTVTVLDAETGDAEQSDGYILEMS